RRRPARAHAFPYTTLFRSLFGRGHRAIDVCRGRAREGADRVARRRVDALEGLTRARVAPLAADVVLEALRPRQCHGGEFTQTARDRKSTRLNSSHQIISYA